MAIIRAPNEGLSLLVQTLLNKERLAQQKEDLNLRKKDFELRQTQAEMEQQRIRDAQMGAQAAVQFLAQQGVLPGFGEAAQNVSPGALPAFAEGVGSFLQGIGTGRQAMAGGEVASRTVDPTVATVEAGARQAGAEADVAQGTVGARTRAAQAGARTAESQARVAEGTEEAQIGQAQANLFNTNLRNRLQSEVLRNDPQRGALAVNTWVKSGGQMTWAEAKEAAGITSEDSIDPNLRFQPPEQGNAMSEAAQKAQSFFPLMFETNQTINSLNEQGVRLNFTSALQQGTDSPTVDAFINRIQDPAQRQLIQANRAFSDYYRFSLSGQQSSPAEKIQMMLSITEQTGDDERTIANKRRLREIMLAAVQARAEGRPGMLAAAQAGLEQARTLNDPEITSAYESLVRDVAEGITSGSSPSAPNFSAVPGAGVPIGDAGNIVNATIDSIFGGSR